MSNEDVFAADVKKVLQDFRIPTDQKKEYILGMYPHLHLALNPAMFKLFLDTYDAYLAALDILEQDCQEMGFLRPLLVPTENTAFNKLKEALDKLDVLHQTVPSIPNKATSNPSDNVAEATPNKSNVEPAPVAPTTNPAPTSVVVPPPIVYQKTVQKVNYPCWLWELYIVNILERKYILWDAKALYKQLKKDIPWFDQLTEDSTESCLCWMKMENLIDSHNDMWCAKTNTAPALMSKTPLNKNQIDALMILAQNWGKCCAIEVTSGSNYYRIVDSETKALKGYLTDLDYLRLEAEGLVSGDDQCIKLAVCGFRWLAVNSNLPALIDQWGQKLIETESRRRIRYPTFKEDVIAYLKQHCGTFVPRASIVDYLIKYSGKPEYKDLMYSDGKKKSTIGTALLNMVNKGLIIHDDVLRMYKVNE